MNRAQRAAQLRARREAIRARLRRRRPADDGRRKRRWLSLVLLILLILLLLRICSCEEPPPEAPAEVLGAADGGEPVGPPAPEVLLPRVERRDRPDYENEAPDPLAWIDAFQLQVAARSPRLAECFVGNARPGALKWTASVEPASGRVSDHTLEPTRESDPLSGEQRACVIGVLSEPPYRLEAEAARSTPSRVAMAIEF